jgi:hypothetical protein
MLPSNFPVNAGLSVSGEEKNWEKCGSWALEKIEQDKKNNNKIKFLITAVSGNKITNLCVVYFSNKQSLQWFFY